LTLVATVAFVAAYFINKQSYTGAGCSAKSAVQTPFFESCFKSNLIYAIWAFFFFVLFCGFSGWLMTANNEPWREEFSSIHEIKYVIYPDGSKDQMFICDNVRYNFTTMFNKIVDEEVWAIKRVRMSRVYLGLDYSGNIRCQNDSFYLQQKIADPFGDPPIELKMPINQPNSQAEVTKFP
jgi:hypothetical protein